MKNGEKVTLKWPDWPYFITMVDLGIEQKNILKVASV